MNQNKENGIEVIDVPGVLEGIRKRPWILMEGHLDELMSLLRGRDVRGAVVGDVFRVLERFGFRQNDELSLALAAACVANGCNWELTGNDQNGVPFVYVLSLDGERTFSIFA